MLLLTQTKRRLSWLLSFLDHPAQQVLIVIKFLFFCNHLLQLPFLLPEPRKKALFELSLEIVKWIVMLPLLTDECEQRALLLIRHQLHKPIHIILLEKRYECVFIDYVAQRV